MNEDLPPLDDISDEMWKQSENVHLKLQTESDEFNRRHLLY